MPHVTRFFLLAFVLLFGMRQARSAPLWGISGGAVLYRNCGLGFCNGGGSELGSTFFQELGPRLSSSVSNDVGTASVQVEFQRVDEALFPNFHATSTTAPSGLYWASSSAIVIEGYQYTGPTNKTLWFGGVLSGEVRSGRPEYEIKAEARLYLFSGESFVYMPHLPSLIYETDATVLTNTSFLVTATNSGVLQSNLVAVSVAPGERFYLFASLALSVFSQGGACQTLPPYEVFCLNPEGLVSESLRRDLALSVVRDQGNLRLSWPPTRRDCYVESSSSLTEADWQPITGEVKADLQGNLLIVPITSTERFFRLRIL